MAKALDQFCIIDTTDPLHATFCTGKAAVREIIDQFHCTAGLQVRRITLDEMVRDVTADFITEDEPDTAFGIPSPDSLRRWHEGRVLVMGTMATVCVNTSKRMVLYRDFIIQEAYVTGKGNVWEWAHEDYCPPVFEAAGDCETLFECIDAVDNWHENRAEADYLDHQQSLMESGGPDDSTYRRDMREAGRGHLVRP